VMTVKCSRLPVFYAILWGIVYRLRRAIYAGVGRYLTHICGGIGAMRLYIGVKK